jgi:hypothetical protein
MLVYQRPFLQWIRDVLKLEILVDQLLLWQKLFLCFRMLPFSFFHDRWCRKLYRILVEWECKLQGVWRIRISVGKELDLPLLLGQRKMYLSCDQLLVLWLLLLELVVAVTTCKFVTIRLVGAEFLFADGQTAVSKLIVAFCKFAKAPGDIMMRGTVFHLELWIKLDESRLSVWLQWRSDQRNRELIQWIRATYRNVKQQTVDLQWCLFWAR